MNWADVVSVIGAAAWLPQIWRLLQRPKVLPIVGGQIEIGFSTLGPLFNPKVAFQVERRQALVTGVEYRVAHQRGQVANFRTVQLSEQGAQSESTSGERAFHQRLQDVVAIVLLPTMIVERKTISREVGCLANIEGLEIRLGRAIDRLRRDGAEWVDDLFRSPEFAVLKEHLESAFI